MTAEGPREGVDYMVDLYGVAGVVSANAPAGEIQTALNKQVARHHPDRLQGTAYMEQGERMTLLLNRARHVLLDPGRRRLYDELIAEWGDRPLSVDGTPVTTLDAYRRRQLAGKTAAEVEDIAQRYRQQLEMISPYDPELAETLEEIVKLDPNNPARRKRYEGVLESMDRTLVLDMEGRAEMLGAPLPSSERYAVEPGYGKRIERQLEDTKTKALTERQALVSGRFATRLALLAGEASPDPEIVAADMQHLSTLPEYYDPQIEQINKLAAEREALLQKRLANLWVEYPYQEQQPELLSRFAAGMHTAGREVLWAAFDLDLKKKPAVSQIEPREDLLKQLATGKYEQVISRGYNVLTFPELIHVDWKTTVLEAIHKHVAHYRPDEYQ